MSSAAASLARDQKHALHGVRPSLVLVGNPNVGKSVIFGRLTRSYVTVSNYPGTTVELTEGHAKLASRDYRVIDTPGTNTLTPTSEDERVTRDVLLAARPHAVVQVADMKNLRRALLLTLELGELGMPMVLVLNMSDEARARGVKVDTSALAAALGIDVIEAVAVRGEGLAQLEASLEAARTPRLEARYAPAIEEALVALDATLPEGPGRRGRGLMALAGDAGLSQRVETTMGGPLRRAMVAAQLAAVDALVLRVMSAAPPEHGRLRERLGLLAMHRLWGFPFLAAVLYAMYEFVGRFGAGTAVDFFQNTVFGAWISPRAIALADRLLPFPHVHALEGATIEPLYTLSAALGPAQSVARLGHDFLVGEYGLLTMALSYALAMVLPIVGTFFLAFGLLEDSGYLPRLAIVVDRLFKRIGLNGKAVLPMVLGLGCDTMATLTSRILETRKERILTILLLTLAVPCSAQLGVILAMLAPLGLAAAGIWLSVVLAVIFAVGWLAARLVPGGSAALVLEVPPLRVPRLHNIVLKTLARMEWYIKEAVPLFLLGTAVLFVADRLGLLVVARELAAPIVVHLLGLPAQAADAFILGFLRRDFGAAGLFKLQHDGLLDPVQTLVALVAVTLFVPCVAQFFVTVKELGARSAAAMAAFVFPFAIAVAALVNALLRGFEVRL